MDQKTKEVAAEKLKLIFEHINLTKEEIQKKKMILIDSVNVQKLSLNNLNQNQLDLLFNFITYPKQRILGKQFENLPYYFKRLRQVKNQFEQIDLNEQKEQQELLDRVRKQVRLNQDELNIEDPNKGQMLLKSVNHKQIEEAQPSLQNTDQRGNTQANLSRTD